MKIGDKLQRGETVLEVVDFQMWIGGDSGNTDMVRLRYLLPIPSEPTKNWYSVDWLLRNGWKVVGE